MGESILLYRLVVKFSFSVDTNQKIELNYCRLHGSPSIIADQKKIIFGLSNLIGNEVD